MMSKSRSGVAKATTAFVLLVVLMTASLVHEVDAKLPIKNVTGIKGFEKAQSKHKMFVLGLFQDLNGENAQLFKQLAEHFEKVPFGVSQNKKLYEQLKVDETSDAIFFFNKSTKTGEKLTRYQGELKEDDLKRFIYWHQIELVNTFTATNGRELFEGAIRVTIMFYVDGRDDKLDDYVAGLEQLAIKYRYRTVFIVIDTFNKQYYKLLSFFNVKAKEIPTIRLLASDTYAKYRPNWARFDIDILDRFIGDFFDNKLTPHLAEQEVPADWNDRPVKVLTSKNFATITNDPTKSVFVNFFAPPSWKCQPCDDLEPIFDDLADVVSLNSEFLLARMDAIANEVEQIKVINYPTLMLYPRGNGEPIQYKGEHKLDALRDFLAEHAKDEFRIAPVDRINRKPKKKPSMIKHQDKETLEKLKAAKKKKNKNKNKKKNKKEKERREREEQEQNQQQQQQQQQPELKSKIALTKEEL